MATNFVSAPVSGGDDALGTQYNNLRSDTIKNGGDFEVTTGTGTALALAIDAAIVAYAEGDKFRFQLNTNITGACTLNVNSIGAVSLKKNHDRDTANRDYVADQILEVVYQANDTIFEILTPVYIPVIPQGFNVSMITPIGVGATTTRASFQVGFSDAATPLIASLGYSNVVMDFSIASDYGITIYPYDYHDNSGVTADFLGCVRIGNDDWTSRATNTIRKNGGDGTFVSGDEQGPLGHDATNSYLLMLTSTTNIRRFSGIAGTALTQVDNITLDTAVTETKGFVFDDTNNQFICIDATANLIRRFTIAGATVDTATYTVDDTYLAGLAIVNNRFYLVMLSASHGASVAATFFPENSLVFIPTSMTR